MHSILLDTGTPQKCSRSRRIDFSSLENTGTALERQRLNWVQF